MSAELDPRTLRPATQCIHAGWRAAPGATSVALPIVPSSTFLLDDRAYDLRTQGRDREVLVYAREGNPTVAAVERKLAALEGAEDAVLFASGQAALHAILLSALQRGQRIACARSVYGGTLGLVRELVPKLGVESALFDAADAASLRAAIGPGARLVLCESLSNPTVEVADLPAIAGIARERGAELAVDSTFASPIAVRPLEHGAAYVYHSATKYLGGHDDLTGGVVCGSAAHLAPIRTWRTRAGGTMDSLTAFLLDRGLKTLALRVRAASQNAQAIARFLAGHPRVLRVHYPFLAGAKGDRAGAVAERLLSIGGGVVSFVVQGGDGAARAVVRRLRIFIEAASLGGVESLASVPAILSHHRFTPEERLAAGIAPGLVRLAVGIEDERDLLEDLEQALEG